MQAIVTPVDLCKIRLQLQTAVRGAPGYTSPLALLASILRTEGLPGEPPCACCQLMGSIAVLWYRTGKPKWQLALRCTPACRSPARPPARLPACARLRQAGQVGAGLYRGTVITFIRDFPSHGVYFAVYEGSRQVQPVTCCM